jgi:hypothetical protein
METQIQRSNSATNLANSGIPEQSKVSVANLRISKSKSATLYPRYN